MKKLLITLFFIGAGVAPCMGAVREESASDLIAKYEAHQAQLTELCNAHIQLDSKIATRVVQLIDNGLVVDQDQQIVGMRALLNTYQERIAQAKQEMVTLEIHPSFLSALFSKYLGVEANFEEIMRDMRPEVDRLISALKEQIRELKICRDRPVRDLRALLEQGCDSEDLRVIDCCDSQEHQIFDPQIKKLSDRLALLQGPVALYQACTDKYYE